jgi:hypothetical protein
MVSLAVTATTGAQITCEAQDEIWSAMSLAISRLCPNQDA